MYQPGSRVLVVNGRGRGCRAQLLQIHEEWYSCDIRMEEGGFAGRTIKEVDYEDISKLSEA